jgi:predicted O-methyltransferase YrrM
MTLKTWPKHLLGTILLTLYSVSLHAHFTKSEWPDYKKQVTHYLPRLEGWCTKEKAERLMNIIKATSAETYVEVGVFGGSSFLPAVAALEYQNKGVGYAIDPWAVAPCLEGYEGANYEWWSKVDYNKIMKGFISRMKETKLDHRYRLMRMTSKEALEHFKDNSISVLHIDGQHAEEPSYFDVTHWLKKVAPKGRLIFDDANWPMTQKAVDYLLQQCDLDPESYLGDPYLVFIKR